ncbi:MAG: hypothetical protein HN855_09295 [Anaerolineae bacterium]|jgi:hypothetical protein|nr:hypothetical protein [Anaerolineae bacterium]MBT7073243.1 hypothetical protein [Anaerolineae bacterium]MBT7325341.1 hypothetical protein [Anaerolineae bacterium]
MATIAFQIWGGIFYLLNKVFFSRAERSNSEQQKKNWRVWAWIVYLLGVPAWVIIFVLEHNWIAAAIETGGAPAMIIGLSIAIRGLGHEPRWLDILAKMMIGIGLTLSLYDFGGITTFNQILELGIAVGFLVGTYLLAKEKAQGYFWFIGMNIFTATLMGLQNYPLLMVQQLISLGFVLDAYFVQRARALNLEPSLLGN